jgi:CheY-like chemotaxis protein
VKFPEQINKNTMRTLGQGVDCLGMLVDPKNLPQTNGLPSPSVLVVDDDADNARELMSAMKMVKVKTSGCDSAKGALNLLNSQKFDLILLDIKMPDINGLELCAMVRRLPQHNKTPIVFVTGAATPESRANSTLAGGNDLIAKPFDLAEIALKSLVWIYKGQIETAQKMKQAA